MSGKKFCAPREYSRAEMQLRLPERHLRCAPLAASAPSS